MPEHSGTSPQGQERAAAAPAPYADEISLIDLWRVLARRKWWIAGITLAVLAAGILYTLAQEPRYPFTTTLDLGRDATGASLREPDWGVSVLNEVLIPDARLQLAQEKPQEGVPAARGTPVADSGFIHLKTTTTTERAEAVARLHARIAQLLAEELAERHEREKQTLSDQRDRLELDRQEKMLALTTSLTDVAHRRTALSRQLSLLQAERELIGEHIEELRPLEQSARELERPDDQTGALPPLFLPRAHVLGLRHAAQRAYVTRIPRAIQELEHQLADLEAQEDQLKARRDAAERHHAGEVESIERALERIRQSGVRSDLAVSGDAPEGPGKALIAALAAVLGLMLGIFGALFREFIARVGESEGD